MKALETVDSNRSTASPASIGGKRPGKPFVKGPRQPRHSFSPTKDGKRAPSHLREPSDLSSRSKGTSISENEMSVDLDAVAQLDMTAVRVEAMHEFMMYLAQLVRESGVIAREQLRLTMLARGEDVSLPHTPALDGGFLPGPASRLLGVAHGTPLDGPVPPSGLETDSRRAESRHSEPLPAPTPVMGTINDPAKLLEDIVDDPLPDNGHERTEERIQPPPPQLPGSSPMRLQPPTQPAHSPLVPPPPNRAPSAMPSYCPPSTAAPPSALPSPAPARDLSKPPTPLYSTFHPPPNAPKQAFHLANPYGSMGRYPFSGQPNLNPYVLPGSNGFGPTPQPVQPHPQSQPQHAPMQPAPAVVPQVVSNSGLHTAQAQRTSWPGFPTASASAPPAPAPTFQAPQPFGVPVRPGPYHNVYPLQRGASTTTGQHAPNTFPTQAGVVPRPYDRANLHLPSLNSYLGTSPSSWPHTT